MKWLLLMVSVISVALSWAEAPDPLYQSNRADITYLGVAVMMSGLYSFFNRKNSNNDEIGWVPVLLMTLIVGAGVKVVLLS